MIERRELISNLISNGSPDFGFIIQNGSQMSLLKRVKGSSVTVGILSMIITEFCQSFNVKQNMAANQVAALAVELADDYWHYKLEDFIAFFNLAKKGVYGKIYDRVDAPTIFQMLEIYNNERENGLVNVNAKFTQSEKYAREKSTNEFDKITTLGGAIGDVKKLAQQNREQIVKQRPEQPYHNE